MADRAFCISTWATCCCRSRTSECAGRWRRWRGSTRRRCGGRCSTGQRAGVAAVAVRARRLRRGGGLRAVLRAASGVRPDRRRCSRRRATCLPRFPRRVALVRRLAAAGNRLGDPVEHQSDRLGVRVTGRFPFLRECFEHAVLSFEARAMKPEAAIFEYAVRQRGRAGGRGVFHRRQPENVAGALDGGARCGAVHVGGRTGDGAAATRRAGVGLATIHEALAGIVHDAAHWRRCIARVISRCCTAASRRRRPSRFVVPSC